MKWASALPSSLSMPLNAVTLGVGRDVGLHRH